MKTKLWQSVTIFSVILFEIFIFSDFKYRFFRWIYPKFEEWILTNVLFIKLFLILTISIIIWVLDQRLARKNERPKFIIYVIKGFQVRGSDYIGITNVIFILCSIGWIGSSLYTASLSGLLNAAIYALLLLLCPIIIVNKIPSISPSRGDIKPKVLIAALSKPIKNKDGIWLLEQSLKKMESELYNKQWKESFIQIHGDENQTQFPWSPWNNFDPIRKSIIKHSKSLEKIYLLCSPDVAEEFRKLPENCLPELFISDFIAQNYPTHKIELFIHKETFSINDLDESLKALDLLLEKIFLLGYQNKDIIFNITGGTLIISGAMLIKAMTAGRQAEYAHQDRKGELRPVHIDVYSAKDLWHELIEKVG